jgi:hypothetical protein
MPSIALVAPLAADTTADAPVAGSDRSLRIEDQPQSPGLLEAVLGGLIGALFGA